MEQYVVPQFIDVESKIVGPITPRQFIVVVIWGLFSFIGYKLLDIAGFVVFFLFWTTLCGLIGFYKVNGRPFYIFVLILIQGKKKPSVRVWRKEAVQISPKQGRREGVAPPAVPSPPVKRLSGSRLSELSLIVDTGGMYQGDFFEEEEKEKE